MDFLSPISEGLDHLVTLPVFNWDNMVARVPMAELNNSLRTKYGKSPLIYSAERLIKKVRPNDLVVIATGFQVSEDTLESDGPVGAATLARALNLGLGAIPVLVVGEAFVESMKALCISVGLKPCSFDKIQDPHGVIVEGFPSDNDLAKDASKKILSQIKPSVLISIESPDLNIVSRYHTAKGYDVSSYQPKFPILFRSAYESGLFTIGIGDFGNEIGMQTLSDVLSLSPKSYNNCRCGCGGGIIGSTVTSSTIIANISNWGAYGLEAALAITLHNPEVMHDTAIEIRVLEESARVGYLDGVTMRTEPSADSAPLSVNKDIVDLLRSLVQLPHNHEFTQFFENSGHQSVE